MAEGVILRRLTKQYPIATGGTETVIEQDGKYYRVHSFTTVGTSSLDVLRGGDLEYLVVAGGASGGSFGGGGGAGGFVPGSKSLTSNAYSVTVGNGGDSITTNITSGENGENSSFFNVIALGGGGGGNNNPTNGSVNHAGLSGGSGGGACNQNFGPADGGAALQPISASGGFGHKGGDNTGYNPGRRRSRGGGGAGTAGEDGNGGFVSPGGDGLPSTIAGTENYYAGGGGGFNWENDGVASGGVGGGGSGANRVTKSQSGLPNTGGGGGGGSDVDIDDSGTGAGGSGIVIVRYRITQAEYEAAA